MAFPLIPRPRWSEWGPALPSLTAVPKSCWIHPGMTFIDTMLNVPVLFELCKPINASPCSTFLWVKREWQWISFVIDIYLTSGLFQDKMDHGCGVYIHVLFKESIAVFIRLYHWWPWKCPKVTYCWIWTSNFGFLPIHYAPWLQHLCYTSLPFTSLL